MKLIIEEIHDYQSKFNYVINDKFEDNNLNVIYNNWLFLSEYVNSLVTLYGETLENILYSEYYWCSKFLREYSIRFGSDAGLEQQQYQLIEKIERTIGSVDWNILEDIENNA